jgi:hypothetical protein
MSDAPLVKDGSVVPANFGVADQVRWFPVGMHNVPLL